MLANVSKKMQTDKSVCIFYKNKKRDNTRTAFSNKEEFITNNFKHTYMNPTFVQFCLIFFI